MMTREVKAQEIATISEKLGKSKATFLVDYKGLNVDEFTTLRKKLFSVKSEILVVRNTLAKRAMKDHPDVDSVLSDDLSGTNALVFAFADASASAKALTEFADTAEELVMKSGAMNGKKLNEAQLKYLATLPGINELRAQFLGLLTAPMSKFLGTLEAAPAGFVRVLNAYKKTKQ